MAVVHERETIPGSVSAGVHDGVHVVLRAVEGRSCQQVGSLIEAKSLHAAFLSRGASTGPGAGYGFTHHWSAQLDACRFTGVGAAASFSLLRFSVRVRVIS